LHRVKSRRFADNPLRRAQCAARECFSARRSMYQLEPLTLTRENDEMLPNNIAAS
jgi:hypothetical protein